MGFNLTAEFLAQVLYGALGGASHNTVPGTTNALLAASPIQSDGQTRTLTAQPSDGGAILQLRLSGTTGSGYLTVAGTDSAGNAASEVISFDAAGTLYTRTSMSAVTGITFNSVQTLGGSIAVNGIKYFEHTIFTATSNPTFSIEKIGDPSAGATSKSLMHPGMVIQSVAFSVPAEARDGVITIDTTWEGDPTATCTATALNDASAIRIWPAWAASFTRDGGAYTPITDFTIDIQAGNRNYRSAAGTQNPQGSFFGAREVTGSFNILLSNETEFNRWRGASKQNLVLTINTPWKLTSSANMKLEASMTSAYLENVTTADAEGAFSYSADYRMIADATNDVIKFKVTNGIPSSVFGASVVLN